MKKISLDLESLRVDSFSTGAAEGGRGTVHARQVRTTTFQTIQLSCDWTAFYESCYVACECTNGQMRCKNPYVE